MNIFDYAMQLEKEGENLYQEFAKLAPNKGMAVIFTILAEQEKRHYEIFEKMKHNQAVSLTETSFLRGIKSIFEEWKNSKEKFNFNVSQGVVYSKALNVEKKSIDFYTEKSKETADAKQKEILLRIAGEERNHYRIIENIIEFINKPEIWVENAEFSKIGEEY
jgi:rubrerythrin